MKIQVIFVALFSVMLFPVFSAAGELVIIGNLSIGESTLSKKEIKLIFLGKKSVWDDGTKVVFAIHKNEHLTERFLKEYVEKSPHMYSNYWRKLVFSGKGSSPPIFDSDQEMIKFVSESKGAIGYVAAGSKLENLKALTIK